MSKFICIRASYPKVHQFMKNGKIRYRIDGRSKFNKTGKLEETSTKTGALQRAKEVAAIREQGVTLSPEQCHAYNYYEVAFQAYGVTVDYVLKTALQNIKETDGSALLEKKKVGELVDRWCREYRLNKFRSVREKTLSGYQNLGEEIKRQWGDQYLSYVTYERVSNYLSNLNVGLRTKKNKSTVFGTFFLWCVKNGYMAANPCARIEIRPDIQREIQYVSVEKVESMFKFMEENEKYRPMILYFALGFFGGFRPEECKRLDKKDYYVMTEQIQIQPSGTKTKTRRVTDVNDTLRAWIKKYWRYGIQYSRRKTNAVWAHVGYSSKRGDANARQADICRHTYATMWLASDARNTFDVLAKHMGNSVPVIKKHYDGVIYRGIAENFWHIIPKADK